MTAEETIAAAISSIDEKKEKLKKAYEDLQAHRSLFSPSLSLSWSDIDSHFSSLQSSLSNRFRLLQSTPPFSDNPPKLPAGDAGASSTVAAAEEEEEGPVVRSEMRSFCEKMDGIGLSKYLIENWDDQSPPNLELSAAFRFSPDPASMVLDAIEDSNHHHAPSGRSLDIRRVYVLLLESLIDINANFEPGMRERAKKLAFEWKKKIDAKPFEALLFLHLLVAFELKSEFDSDEVSDYLLMIAKYKQATLVCNKIGVDSERGRDLVKKLLDSEKPILAVKFMYECGMSNGFEPVAVLKAYIKSSREASHMLCVEHNHSLKSQNEATDKEVSALKAVIKIIKEQCLESEFSEEKVEERVEELERLKAQRKRAAANPQQEGRKRARVVNGSTQTQAQSQAQNQHHFPRQEHVHNHGLQLNPFALVNSGALGGGVVFPYVNPLAGLYGAGPTPQSVYYGQQQTGFVLPPQYQPPYYSR
ncbi:unnamed protein product [Cochlearia groenlandica]